MGIKLVIWDLDDTLWQGTLAEGDKVTLHPARAEMVRALNRHGVVSAICSKNDPAKAEQTLRAMQLWDEFVFPRIAFVPKGEAVRQLIADMQLRPANVLLIDDNEINLNEVKALLPEIHTVNAATPEADALLANILEENKGSTHSRRDEYRRLQQRVGERAAHGGSNEDFLRACDIRITLVKEQDNIVFRQRIMDLVNRSNQLNFTQSRIEDADAFFELLQDRHHHYSFSVFVRDKYGDHGLVGFVMIRHPDIPIHFVFSCRIMHMGIENWLWALFHRRARFKYVAFPEIERKNVDWIREEDFLDPAVRARIMRRHAEVADTGAPKLRIMFDCQSAAVAHFTGLGTRVDFDNAPRVFELWQVMEWAHIHQSWPKLLVYGPFSDYSKIRWKTPYLRYDFYSVSVASERFCTFIEDRKCKMLVLLAPENLAPEKYTTIYSCPYKELMYFNQLWRRLAAAFPDNITLYELSAIATDDNAEDARHYKTSMLKTIANHIREWALTEDPEFETGEPAPEDKNTMRKSA